VDDWPAVAAAIGPLDAQAMAAARAHQARLTKPAGSLGRLEHLALQLAGVQGRALPTLSHRAVIVMAADHGVASEGVSAYPPVVTAQMVANFLAGGAAINVLARQADARLVVVDVGVATDLPPGAVDGLSVPGAAGPAHLSSDPGASGSAPRSPDSSATTDKPPSQVPTRSFRRTPIGPGTANLAIGPAMSRAQAEAAIAVGLAVVADESVRGLDAVVLGDMGIGNTTAGAALVAALCEQPAAAIVGRGTGLDDTAVRHKVAVVERALVVNRPDPADPLGTLAALGGFEHAGLVGVILGAAARRAIVVVDGLAAAAAALVAARLCPAVVAYLVAGHASVEPAQRAALMALDLQPLLDLDLRLGEGTGGALALQLLDAAVRLHADMATFDAAGVSERQPG
jgi:nicotinate-nucleotide--dimethylbenzimidazole phosphoribosyltransferase